MNKRGNILVYIVDDDKTYSEMLKNSIEINCKELEPQVELFVVGEIFLMSIDKKPDLVILDYFLNTMFPDAMDGLEVLEKINEKSPNTKVIMLSARNNPRVAQKAIEMGAYDYIVKDQQALQKIKELVEEVYEEKRSFFRRIANFFTGSTLRKNLAVLENR